jgi:hypothetical protein
MKRWMVVLGATVVMSAVGAAGGSTRAAAKGRGRWQDVVAPRSTLAPTPARSGEGPPLLGPDPVLEHSAADRMREALVSPHNDPQSAAKLERLIAQAAAEARRNRALGERVWYWRDPFSDRPRQPIVLSVQAQLEMQVAAARLEAVRARIESAAARVEAASARAEAAHARSEAARVQAASGTAPAPHPRRRVAPFAHLPLPAAHALPLPESALAQNDRESERLAAHESRHRDVGPAPILATTPPATVAERKPTTLPTSAPAPYWRSKNPRGMVIVPINSNSHNSGGGNRPATRDPL